VLIPVGGPATLGGDVIRGRSANKLPVIAEQRVVICIVYALKDYRCFVDRNESFKIFEPLYKSR
jgi:hypothetical protein